MTPEEIEAQITEYKKKKTAEVQSRAHRKYYQANKEKILARQRERYAERKRK